jgi:hypothetical protein
MAKVDATAVPELVADLAGLLAKYQGRLWHIRGQALIDTIALAIAGTMQTFIALRGGRL